MAAPSITERQCWRPFSRGVLVVLLLSGLTKGAHLCVYNAIYVSFQGNFRLAFAYTGFALWVLLPVTGWVAESWLGRYRVILVGLMLSVATNLMILVAFITQQLDWSPIPALVLGITGLVLGTIGIGGLYTNMLPFTLDQIIGASAEELSAVVQWYCWGHNIAQLVINTLQCIPLQFVNLIPVIILTVGCLSTSAALIMDCLCYKWLDTHKKTGNPIKLIFQVLNYARKNTYPRLRSAFTYIDEEQPSRLDFGKHKFGGPFTEEEVEDVKTVFRLALLLATICGVLLVGHEIDDQFGLHAIPVTKLTFDCISKLKARISQATAFVLIPAYRFIVYPLVGKYIPSMLKIMGAGSFLCLVSTIFSLVVNSIGHLYSNASQCIFDDNIVQDTIPIPLYWVLIIDIMNGVGILLTILSLYEFVMAQTPNRMRGIMMGLTFTFVGIDRFGLGLLAVIFRQFPTATPSCVFYYYLVLSLLMLLILVVYVILAKRYKLRERDRHINIHAIVEEHYERYFDQEEEYIRENDHSISIDS